jgi:hypothetical protein
MLERVFNFCAFHIVLCDIVLCDRPAAMDAASFCAGQWSQPGTLPALAKVLVGWLLY